MDGIIGAVVDSSGPWEGGKSRNRHEHPSEAIVLGSCTSYPPLGRSPITAGKNHRLPGVYAPKCPRCYAAG
jgi:hypothetical protein